MVCFLVKHNHSCEKYKHKSAKIIERALMKASLNYHFVNAAYLDALTEGVIFTHLMHSQIAEQ